MTNGKKLLKRAAKKTVKVARRIKESGVLSPQHEEMLTALTDPFSSLAADARYPDQSAGRSLTFQQRSSLSLASDPSGDIAFCVAAKCNYNQCFATGVAGNVATWPAAYQGNHSTNLINTYGRDYRPTSVGIRVANMLSATNSSGYIVIAKGGPPVLGSTTTFDPSNFESWDMHPLSHGGEWHTTLRPRTAGAYVPTAVSGATTTSAEGDWENCFIFITGAPNATATVVVEIFANFEYSPLEDAPIAQLAKQTPVLDIGLQTAVNAVQGAHPPSHKGSTSVVKNFIKKEGKKALMKHVLPFVAKKVLL